MGRNLPLWFIRIEGLRDSGNRTGQNRVCFKNTYPRDDLTEDRPIITLQTVHLECQIAKVNPA
jgi:hypothetical protein